MSPELVMDQSREFLAGLVTGAIAVFGFGAAAVKFIWSFLSKAKDDQIKSLTKQVERLERMLDDERRDNELAQARLVARIQNLEGMVLLVAPQSIKPAIQRKIEEEEHQFEQRP